MSAHALRWVICSLSLAAAAGTAGAVTVRVQVQGVVDFNLIAGGLAGITAGAPATLAFNVDSTNYLDSANFPTRGYRIDLASFDLNIGGVHMALDNPQTGGDVFFVLRNNDPAVDGFFISRNGVELPTITSMHVPGLTPVHEFQFSRSFSVGTALSSLDIVDAVGNYGFENMGAYLWSIGRFGNIGLEVVYQSMSITAVPEPATYALFALGGGVLLAAQRRRRSA